MFVSCDWGSFASHLHVIRDERAVWRGVEGCPTWQRGSSLLPDTHIHIHGRTYTKIFRHASPRSLSKFVITFWFLHFPRCFVFKGLHTTNPLYPCSYVVPLWSQAPVSDGTTVCVRFCRPPSPEHNDRGGERGQTKRRQRRRADGEKDSGG